MGGMSKNTGRNAQTGGGVDVEESANRYASAITQRTAYNGEISDNGDGTFTVFIANKSTGRDAGSFTVNEGGVAGNASGRLFQRASSRGAEEIANIMNGF